MSNDTLVMIFQWIFFALLCQLIDIFGIVTNIINIICFVKQGFKDPVNVSLLGLAISDLGCLASLILANLCCTPAFNAADLPFESVEFQYLTAAIPHTAFTRVTAWLTALITLERCLCITAPLKVKRIVTQKRLSVVIAGIFFLLLSSVAPIYVVNRLKMKFYPLRNKTLIGLIFREDREFVERISFAVNNSFVPFSAFIVIIICTIMLVVKLREARNWRKSTTTSQTDNVSIRNQKVAKMVVMISTLFIACFLPVSTMFIAMASYPGFSLDGSYRHVLIIMGGFAVILESINSASNIFIYYYMSTNYRSTFNEMFFKK